MKNKKIIHQLMLVSFAILFIVSCRKEQTEKQQYRIVSSVRTNGAGSTIDNISYNGMGKVSQITQFYNGNLSNTIKFIYADNSNLVTVLNTNSAGIILNKKVITLNEKGKPGTIRTEFYNSTGGIYNWINVEYTYNYNGHLSQTVTTSPGNTSVTQSTISNGDVVAVSESGIISGVLEYYEDKSYLQGDFLGIQAFVSTGIENSFGNTHLLKSYKLFDPGSSTIFTSLSYQFDDKGLISKIIATFQNNGSTASYSYAYQYEPIPH